MISIGKLINNTLRDSSIGVLTNNNIFPLHFPANTPSPYVFFQRQNIIPLYTNDGLSGNEVTVSIAIVSNDYNQTLTLAEIIRSLYEKKRIIYKDIYIKDSELEGVDEDFINDFYLQVLTFKFKTN